MSENRRQILDMLAQGKITADEAERLMNALEREPSAVQAGVIEALRPADKLKYLRVVVDAPDGEGEGAAKVNVRVPLQLLRAGVKLSGVIPARARDQVNAALREKGIDFDVARLTPESLETIIEQLRDLSVDVDNGRNKVRVFCE
jgi:hypothetical protein